VLTAASFTAMTFYALVTRKELNIFGSIMTGTAMCMLTIGLLIALWGAPLLRMIYSGLAVIFALIFVAVDT
jgi:FtsH-binding integral membrane protein